MCKFHFVRSKHDVSKTMEAGASNATKKVISEVTQEYKAELQQFLLSDIRPVVRREKNKDNFIEEENDGFRKGAYGKIVDLTHGETKCVGKVLHAEFFATGTDRGEMRHLLIKFYEEIKLLSRMEHPNIVRFLGLYQQGSSLPVLVMEKMSFSLTQYLSTHEKGSISQQRELKILLDVAQGLVYLHEKIKVAHRDLSSNNILLDSHFNAKIADLGSARVLDKPGGWDVLQKLTVQPGVLDFMPPETLLRSPVYTVSVDVFSFACVIIHVCTHKWPTPVYVNKGKYITEIGRRKKYIMEMGESYLVPIVKKCLDDLRTFRPTSKEVLSLLLEGDKTRPSIGMFDIIIVLKK